MSRDALLSGVLLALLIGLLTGCDLLGGRSSGEDVLPEGRIVFTQWDSDDAKGRTFVYAMNTDGSDRTRLTFPDEKYPCDSPRPGEENVCNTGSAYSHSAERGVRLPVPGGAVHRDRAPDGRAVIRFWIADFGLSKWRMLGFRLPPRKPRRPSRRAGLLFRKASGAPPASPVFSIFGPRSLIFPMLSRSDAPAC